MSILTIWASPNLDGLTAKAKDKINDGINEISSDTNEVIHLNRMNVKRCLTCADGWGKCRTDGTCIIEDDFALIYKRLMATDAIIWITPVYWHDVAECLKTLLDRLRRCETAHNHFLRGKKSMIVACAGGTGLGVTLCLSRLEETLEHMGIKTVDRLPVIQFNKAYMLPALYEAGKAFAQKR